MVRRLAPPATSNEPIRICIRRGPYFLALINSSIARRTLRLASLNPWNDLEGGYLCLPPLQGLNWPRLLAVPMWQLMYVSANLAT